MVSMTICQLLLVCLLARPTTQHILPLILYGMLPVRELAHISLQSDGIK